jgi:hypothetical protein
MTNSATQTTNTLSVMQLVSALRSLAQRQGHSGPPLDPMTQLCATIGHFDPMVSCQAALQSVQSSQRRAQSAIAAIKLPTLVPAVNAPARKFAA